MNPRLYASVVRWSSVSSTSSKSGKTSVSSLFVLATYAILVTEEAQLKEIYSSTGAAQWGRGRKQRVVKLFSYSLCISAVFSANIALKVCREVIEVLTCQLVRSFVGTLLRWIRKFGENVDFNWTKMKVNIFVNLKSNGPVLWKYNKSQILR